jgi:ATP-binding cassette subfamily F protein uup
MRDFLFMPEQRSTPVGALSGGERGRLMLAKAFLKPSNLLVLDEPTNDLDLETLDLFQDLIGDYAGTLILVSHDRDFLDRIASSVLIAEGDGHWTDYAGGYSDMVAQRGRGLERASPKKPPAARKRITAAPAPASPRLRRLSFKDKHALERLPGAIAALEQAVAALAGDLADPSLYGRDPEGYRTRAAALEAKRQELAAAEEEWLRLALLLEEIEQSQG